MLAPESRQDSDREKSSEVLYSEELDGVDVVIKDIYGLLVLKDELPDWTRKGSTILTPTCRQNPIMLDTYFKSILGGSAWGAKPKKIIREKYFMSPDHSHRLKAASLKGTKLNMAIKGLEFAGLTGRWPSLGSRSNISS